MGHAIVTAEDPAGGGAVTATRTGAAGTAARPPASRVPPQPTGPAAAAVTGVGAVRAGQVVADAGRGGAARRRRRPGRRPSTAAALLLAAVLLPAAWVRLRGRWLFEWLAVGLAT